MPASLVIRAKNQSLVSRPTPAPVPINPEDARVSCQVLSASLLRKHPANTTSNGGTGQGPSPSTTTLDDSTMGGGALQQLAVDLAVSNLEPMLAGHGRYPEAEVGIPFLVIPDKPLGVAAQQ